MRLCILHAGQPKTGSTALQACLSAHRAALLARGLLYPEAGRAAGLRQNSHLQHGGLFLALAGRRTPGLPPGLPGALDAELRATPHAVLLLSAEVLARQLFLRPEPAVRAFLGERGYRIATVTWLRDQPDFLDAMYAQHAKQAHEPRGFDAFVAARAEGLEDGDMRRFAAPRHRDWGRHLFRPFSASVRAEGIGADFARALGGILAAEGLADLLDAATVRLLGAAPRMNEAEGPTLVAAGRLVARRLAPRFRPRQLRFVTARAFATLLAAARPEERAEPRFTALTPARAARIRQACRETNARFAARVWGRSWEEVFPPPPEAALVPNDPEDTGDGAALARAEALADRAMPAILEQVRAAEARLAAEAA